MSGSGIQKLLAVAGAGLVIAATVAVAGAGAHTDAAARTAAVATTKPAADCQPYSSTPCLLPFPNNLYTRSFKGSPTGLRLDLPAAAMPVNTKGQRVGTAPYDRNDGFSPGSAAIVHVNGLDNAKAFANTGSVGLLNMAASFKKNAPIVVIDESTGQRQMIYTQLDANASTPATTDLMITPGKEFTDGHTYIVAMRNLRNANDQIIKAPSWFEKLRDGRRLPANERSQLKRYTNIFAALKRAGIARKSLYEAWDFTVASEGNLTGRLLAIRNNAFAQLGDSDLANGKVVGKAPAFTITSDQPLSGSTGIQDIQGTFNVPCYLTVCGPAATAGFHYSSSAWNATPTQSPGNGATALFECIVPSSASASNPARISLYGHGLLGSMDEVTDSWVTALAEHYNMVFCATNWWGLANPDTAFDIQAIQNLNLFPNVIDRLQQGVLNTLFLGRLMDNQAGLASNADFQSGGKPLIDTAHLYYDGNSQGGIEGGLTTAVSPDFRRAVLGVTGMDYGNMLVQRSTDFAPFKAFLEGSYPDRSMYTVILDLTDQLWDRGDPDGYAEYMTSDSLPDTPTHTVLMQNAYGDFQVSEYAGAAEARAIGASVYEPALDTDRSADRNLYYGLPAVTHFPFSGSVVEIWDSGIGRVQQPPVGNIPPTPASNNTDPHENPRDTPAAQAQISAFLEPNGSFINICGGSPCHSSVYTP
jgi:hypothetical protein